MSLIDDLAAFIDASSTALTLLSGTAGNLGKAVMLDDTIVPDTVVSLYETAGSPNAYTFSTATGGANVEWERPGLQVISRSTIYPTARANAQIVYTLLDGLAGRSLPTATGTSYLDITAVQAPFSIGRDEGERHLVSLNFQVQKAV